MTVTARFRSDPQPRGTCTDLPAGDDLAFGEGLAALGFDDAADDAQFFEQGGTGRSYVTVSSRVKLIPVDA
ncbi:hypothetical protein ACFOJ6_07090 [Gordonia humi]|uniref:hypothetical protein n=1 Tax=Gordonia humi TaxID=686429 RepID=UPI0036116D51